MKAAVKELNDFYTGKITNLTGRTRDILLSIDFIKRIEPSMPLKGDVTDVWRNAQCKALAYDTLTPLARRQIELLGVKRAIYHALGKKTWPEWIGRMIWWLVSISLGTIAIGLLINWVAGYFQLNFNDVVNGILHMMGWK